MERILVTSALPYANGPIHIGHIAGAYLPADIYVRFNKLMQNDVIYVCGTDEHGVPITITADKEHITPKDVVDKYHAVIKKSFEDLNIDFTHFSRTTIPIHYETSQQFFLDLLENGLISTDTEKQFYCEACKRFLADRYVEGTCPHCGNENARGDECSKCGKWLEAQELKNPRCKLSGDTPILRETKHWYLDLDKFQAKLEKWLQNKHWKDNVKNFVFGWFKEGLQKRPITRDLNWGIPLPLKGEDTKGKVLYVWFDAPIGYISITKEWAAKNGTPDKWKDYWLNSKTRLVHFIGKDNIPFHAIVWPSLLMGQKTNYILPDEIPANEHLTIEGEKISTSQGNAVWIDEFIAGFPADYLRYYLASNAPENKDADFSWKNFQAVLNNELINVIANLFNRVLTFTYSNFEATVPPYLAKKSNGNDQRILDLIKTTLKKAKELYTTFQVREVTKLIADLGREGNLYFQSNEPWQMIKSDKERAGSVINICLRLIEALTILYYPIIPESSKKMWSALNNQEPLAQINLKILENITDPAGRAILKPSPLFRKIEDSEIEKYLSILNQRVAAAQNQQKTPVKTASHHHENIVELISIDDFKKVELKTGKILTALKVEKSDKLLKTKVKIGSEERQIVAGIAQFHSPEEIIGKTVVVVTNLKPAKLMGLESQGMLLAAKNEKTLKLLILDEGLEDGLKIS